MGQPKAVALRGTRLKNFCSSVVTRLMSHTADLGNSFRTMPSRLMNWLVPSQLPTTETVTPVPPEKQGPPTDFTAGRVWLKDAFKLLALIALMVVVIFGWQAYQNTQSSGKCVLPVYPEHGTYMHDPVSKPGDRFETLNLTVICQHGYGVLGTETVFCLNGSWSDAIPQCVRFCKLDKHPSVHYHCLVTGSIEGRRECNDYEPEGTVVRPECNTPHYYSAVTPRSMRCIDGSWDRVVVCSPECGRVTPNGVPLVTDGRSAEQGELPWHVGIYRKNRRPYEQICSGSIITESLVISAAHCFWDDVLKQRPASEFAVAAGKIYRPWNNTRDINAQKSDVKEINIPVHFQGSAANYQADIAVIILEFAFVYTSFVRPICLDFDGDFDRSQLQPGKLGKVAGWGLTAENGIVSQILQVIHHPYVGTKECFAASPLNFIEYITTDKICAGYGNGKALCRGDSGGGLAFPESERGKDRFYLRGVASTAATNENLLPQCATRRLPCKMHSTRSFELPPRFQARDPGLMMKVSVGSGASRSQLEDLVLHAKNGVPWWNLSSSSPVMRPADFPTSVTMLGQVFGME